MPARWIERLRPASAREAAVRRTLLWLFAGGFVLRLLYFVEHGGSAFYQVPILDEAFYDAVARALLQGEDISAINPAFRPLLYPAFLALAYGVGGAWGWSLALAVQHLLGLVTALLVSLMATRLFDRPAAGIWAGALYLLAGPPLFFEGELLIVTLFTTLATAWLAFASTLRADSAPWRWLVAGLALALLVQARANALVLAAAFPLAALALPGAVPRRRRLALAATALVALAASLLAIAAVQAPLLGRFQAIPGAGGVNLYLGNERGADGMVPRQDEATSYGDAYRDSVQLFAVSTYRRITGDENERPDPGAVSRFWLRRTAAEIAADPAAWTWLVAKKAWLLVWNHEVPNNKSFAFMAREESRLLGLLPVRFFMLLALAGVGALVLGGAHPRDGTHAPERSAALWLALYVVLLGAAVVAFFVNARFRLPLWPALAVVAGGGAAALVDAVRRRPGALSSHGRLREALLIAAGLALLSVVNWLQVPPIDPHRDYFFRSVALLEKDRVEEALEDARRSVELEPSDAAAHFQLSAAALTLDRLDEAELHVRRAAELSPREPRVLNQLGVVLEKRGQMSTAYQAYVRATELGPGFSPAWTNAALLELRSQALPRAARSIERAEKLGDRSVALQCARAFLEIKRGRVPFGQDILRGALERDRDLVNRLLREQERPLRLGWGDRRKGDLPPEERKPSPESAPPTGR